MNAWHCTIRLDPVAATRPGTLARICGVLSERGISISGIHAGDDGEEATVTLSFAAAPALAGHLRRRLARSAMVRAVELRAVPPGG